MSSHEFLKLVARRATWLIGITLAIVYGWITLRGPQGFDALIEKHREVRELEEQNAAQAHENELRKERIQRLEHSQSEQEMEIRKNLKLLRPGETTFILPDAPKTDGSKSGTPQADSPQPSAPDQ